MQMLTTVNAVVFMYAGSNATLKGIVKQLKMADTMIIRSHLLLKLSLGQKMNLSFFFSSINLIPFRFMLAYRYIIKGFCCSLSASWFVSDLDWV